MTRASEWMVLGAVLALGCGGSDNGGSTTTPPIEAPVAQAEPTPAPTETAAAPPPTPAMPAVPVEEPVVESKSERAEAEVKPVGKSKTAGKLTFEVDGGKVKIAGTFTGLPPGEHGFLIRDDGDCDKQAKKAGKDFNPTNVKHGPPESGTRHAGDLGNLVADKEGNASFEMLTDSLTIADGADSVVGRAIVITAKKDDGKSQPSGNSGKAIGCGKIERRDAQVSGL